MHLDFIFFVSLLPWLSFGQRRASVFVSAGSAGRLPRDGALTTRQGPRAGRAGRSRPSRLPSAAAKGRRVRSSAHSGRSSLVSAHRILRPLGGSSGEALASLRLSPPLHGPPPPPLSPSLAAPPPPPSRGAASGDSQPPSLARGLPRPSAVVVWAGGRAKGREGGRGGAGAR